MALLTGGCDDFGCILKGIGIDDTEFSAPHAGGRIDVYQGLGQGGSGAGAVGAALSGGTAGNCTTASCPLWSSRTALDYYDVIILSCECAEHAETKPSLSMEAMHDWLGEGGKLFATHFQYAWFRNNPAPDFQTVATWLGPSPALGSGSYTVDTAHPKGVEYRDWLQDVGLVDAGATIGLTTVADSVSILSTAAVRWIYDPGSSTSDAKAFSFVTPIGGVATDGGSGSGKLYCGRSFFTDVHAGGYVAAASTIPSGCPAAGLSNQQRALEFLFFETSACAQDDAVQPALPPP
ncbi:MAG: hypothetical protein ACRENE_03270 [Polyangiaceae bacterium]